MKFVIWPVWIVCKLVHPKGNQSWIFIERTDAEAETPILWPLDAKNLLIWKDPDAGKDWRQEENSVFILLQQYSSYFLLNQSLSLSGFWHLVFMHSVGFLTTVLCWPELGDGIQWNGFCMPAPAYNQLHDFRQVRWLFWAVSSSLRMWGGDQSQPMGLCIKSLQVQITERAQLCGTGT